ncbi:MAG: hypothetical protein ACSHXK_16715 [Oceanococcus sp.]
MIRWTVLVSAGEVSAGEESGPEADRGVSKAKSDIVLSPLF